MRGRRTGLEFPAVADTATRPDYAKGLLAGLIVTAVLSLLMLTGSALLVAPGFDLIDLAAAALGMPGEALVGWAAHFLVGTVAWGLLYAALEPRLPGEPWVRGALFGVLVWLLMMLALMPLAGRRPFGLDAGAAVPAMALLLHLVFGAALGLIYALLRRPRAVAAAPPPGSAG